MTPTQTAIARLRIAGALLRRLAALYEKEDARSGKPDPARYADLLAEARAFDEAAEGLATAPAPQVETT